MVSDAVNSVGVNLNTASSSLLSYVSGLSKAISKNIIAYREQNGRFNSREELKKVSKLGSICQQIWKTQQWPQDRKVSVFIPVPKKGNVKEYSNYHTIELISHDSKVMLKILQERFNST